VVHALPGVRRFPHTPPDPFNVEHDPDSAQAHTTAYLHPILRRYQGDRLVAEHHIPEDLENVYSAAKYEGLIREIFRRELAARYGTGEELPTLASAS
jgi:hypothetical protein